MLDSHGAVTPKKLNVRLWKTGLKRNFCWALKDCHCAMGIQQLRTISILKFDELRTSFDTILSDAAAVGYGDALPDVSGAPYVAIGQDRGALLGNFTNHVFIVYYAQVSKPKTTSR